MKKVGILTLVFITSTTAFAFDYSISSDPVRKKFLDHYSKDQAILYKQDVFLPPKGKQKWACPVSKEDQYKLVDLLQNEPLEKETYKKDSNNLKNTSSPDEKVNISNVQIIPLKTHCVDGKISGDIELRTEYDIDLEQTLGNKPSQKILVSKIHKIIVNSGTIKNGSLIGIAKSFTKFSALLGISKSMDENAQNFSNPIVTLGINYKDSLGNQALFIQNKKLNGIDYILQSSFTSIIDKYHTRKTTYMDNQISQIQHFKNGLSDGDQVGYIVGNEEQVKLLQKEMPHMNPKLVKINGKYFIETHLCMQNDVIVDKFPCMLKD